MKLLVLLSVLGLAVGCGTDVNHTRTLASEEETEQTKKGNRALKIAGITAGVALAGCVIVGVVKKKCIPFAKKVAQNVEDAKTSKSADPSKKVASESAGVSGAKPKQGEEPDLDNVQKEAKASEGDEVKSSASSESSSSSAKPKQDDEPDLDNVQKETKDSEVKEQEVQTTAESSSSSAKPKQDDEPDLEDTQKTAKDSEGDEVKSSASGESSPVEKTLSDSEEGVKATSPSSGAPKDLGQMLKAMEEAGIPVSFETFEKLRKNMEDGSVFISPSQLIALFRVGRGVLTETNKRSLDEAREKGFNMIRTLYDKFTDRAIEIASEADANYREVTFAQHHLAIQQLVEEGIFTDEIVKKVRTAYFDEWQPVTEIFK